MSVKKVTVLDVKRIETEGKKVKPKLNYRQREKTAGDFSGRLQVLLAEGLQNQ